MKLTVVAALVASLLSAPAASAQDRLPDDSRQSPVSSAKRQRSAAQAKINTHLLDAIEQARKQKSPPAPSESSLVDIDAKRRALVDLRAEVTDRLLALVRKLGGEVQSTAPPHHSIIARVPLNKLETLAADDGVQFIEPAAVPTTNRKKMEGS